MSALPPSTGPPHEHSTARAGDDGQLRQEHSRRRPDHDSPVRETIMAPTILTLIASDAKAAIIRGFVR